MISNMANTTANEQFKERSGGWLWYSIATAAVLHLVLFAFWPEMTAADIRGSSDELVALELPPELDVPPPPEQIARPAAPVVSTSELDDDITIPPTTFEHSTPERLAAPPTRASSREIDDFPQYVPMTVRPALRNQAEIERVLVRTYPSTLRDAGVGGTPVLWFLIDESGRVLQTRLHTSSGYSALDEAAQKVAESMRFSPAMNRGEAVKVWIEIPIKFQSR